VGGIRGPRKGNRKRRGKREPTCVILPFCAPVVTERITKNPHVQCSRDFLYGSETEVSVSLWIFNPRILMYKFGKERAGKDSKRMYISPVFALRSNSKILDITLDNAQRISGHSMIGKLGLDELVELFQRFGLDA
jgi:hypothetical protein